MKKNILACENKNRRTLRYYSNPYKISVFNSFNLNNNRIVEDGCLKGKDSFQTKTQKLYDKLNDVKEKLKKIDWNKVSNNWEVSFRKNQYSNYILVNLNPYQDCSPENPLYMHKEWVEKIYYDKDFQMTDEKFAKLLQYY